MCVCQCSSSQDRSPISSRFPYCSLLIIDIDRLKRSRGKLMNMELFRPKLRPWMFQRPSEFEQAEKSGLLTPAFHEILLLFSNVVFQITLQLLFHHVMLFHVHPNVPEGEFDSEAN